MAGGNLELPKEIVLFKHANVQRGGGGQKGYHGLRYHPYLSLESVHVRVAVVFGHGDFMQCHMQITSGVFLGDMRPFCMHHEEQSTIGSVSWNTVAAEMTREVNENSSMKEWANYFTDTSIAEEKKSLESVF